MSLIRARTTVFLGRGQKVANLPVCNVFWSTVYKCLYMNRQRIASSVQGILEIWRKMGPTVIYEVTTCGWGVVDCIK